MNMKEAEALGIDLETVDPVEQKQKQSCEVAAGDRTIIDEIYAKVSCI